MVQYLSEAGGRERVRLVLNRYRKIPGFNDSDAESATGAKVMWKIPNQYAAVSAAIDNGNPLTEQGSTDIVKAFQGLAAILVRDEPEPKRSSWSIFRNAFQK